MMEARLHNPVTTVGTERVRTIAYWLVTSIVAYEMIAGSMWDVARW